MSTKTRGTKGSLPTTYDGLCRILMPRRIHDDVELGNVQELTDRLAVLPRLNQEQEDYLETLSQLIEAYEAERVKISHPSGLDTLRHLVERNEIDARQLGEILGKNASLAYKLLSGDRQITVEHSLKLARHFKLNVSAFIP